MIDGLRPYPEYKYSGVAWLGEVPGHWDVLRLRNVADMRVSNVDKHSRDDERPVRLCNYVDVYKNDRIRSGMAFMRATATVDEIERFRLRQGDVLITKDSEAWNDIGVPALVEQTADDIISGYHLALLRPFTGRVAGGYLFRALQSTSVAYQFHVEANGVTRYGLSHSAIKSAWLPVPPLVEQAVIVRFLDHADRRIRRYIRAKQKLNKLLEEQKQAIIHRAVTRGLDPKVRLKPSGVEWLGDVPEHWAVARLKFVATAIVDCLHATPEYVDDGEFPAIRTADISPGVVQLDSARRIGATEYARWTQRMEPKEGDILYSREGERFGIAACVPHGVQLCISQRMMAFRIRPEYNPTFVMWLLNSPQVYAQATQDVMGATAPHVNVWTIRNYALALPPGPEQDKIVEAIESAVSAINPGIILARREIRLLREYRTRLIADVVTGKLDVREAALLLPDEVEESEPPDEAETDGEDVATDDLDAIPEEAEA